MKASIRAAWVIAVALLAYAVPASAVDFGGYFRDSWGVNSKGGGQACYKVVGGDYKLRLGNECDNYGEWGLSQNLYKGKDGVEMSVGVMVDYDQLNGFPTGSGNPGFQVQQNWVKMKFPQLNGATFWAGKQYYERENIDMIDFFYLNMSDTGIGFEDMDTGFGKLSFSIFGVNMGPTSGGQGSIAGLIRPEIRLQGIPVWTDGTLEFDANVGFISRNTNDTFTTAGVPKPPNEASSSVFVTGEWHQNNIIGGNNTFLVQYANGALSGMGGGTPGFDILASSIHDPWQTRPTRTTTSSASSTSCSCSPRPSYRSSSAACTRSSSSATRRTRTAGRTPRSTSTASSPARCTTLTITSSSRATLATPRPTPLTPRTTPTTASSSSRSPRPCPCPSPTA